MTTDRDGMWRAVMGAPEDDTRRLVFADLVQGEGEEELAALIRRSVPCHCVRPLPYTTNPECYTCNGTGWAPCCEHEGCRAIGSLCEVDTLDDQPEQPPPEWYCGTHAATHGFCPSCGSFWGGISSFEDHGLCDMCRAEEEDDEFEDDWDDVEYGPDPDDPYTLE